MIILVYGLPGTGKSWLSRHLAREFHAIHLNTDIVRDELGKKGDYSQASRYQVYDQLMEQAGERLKQGRNVIIDGTFHKKEKRTSIREIARKSGKDIFFIEMQASEKTIAGRLEKKRDHSEADFEVYLKLKGESDYEGEQRLTLFSDAETEEEMITRVKDYIYGYQANQGPGR
jgi:predicted kinase